MQSSAIQGCSYSQRSQNLIRINRSAECEKEAKVEKVGMYETLLVYRKTA